VHRVTAFVVLLFASAAWAIDFDGVDDYVSIPTTNMGLSNSSACTVALWVKNDTDNDLDGFFMLNPSSGNNSYLLCIYFQTDANNSLLVTTNGGGSGKGAKPSSNFDDTTWNHVVVTKASGTTVQPIIYINGVSNSVASSSGLTGWATNVLHLGRGVNASYYSNCKMEDVRIYNRVLSSNEILSLYGATRATALKRARGALASGLVGWYEMHDAAIGADVSGTGTVHDSTGKDHGDGIDGADGSLIVTEPASNHDAPPAPPPPPGSNDPILAPSFANQSDNTWISVTPGTIGNRTGWENNVLQIAIGIYDPDGDTLSLNTIGLPTGATCTADTDEWTYTGSLSWLDAQTRELYDGSSYCHYLFEWTPSYTQSGNHVVTFTASDGTNTDAETITITITDLTAPTSVPVWSDFTYAGAFRLPKNDGYPAPNDTFAYSRGYFAFYPSGDSGAGSIYYPAHINSDGKFSEVDIPSPLGSGTDPSTYPYASVLRPFDLLAGPYEATMSTRYPGFQWETNGVACMQVPGLTGYRLFWIIRRYYNTGSVDYESHGVSDVDIATPNAVGVWNIGPGYDNNLSSLYLSPIDPTWADANISGYRLLTGASGVAGQGTSSFGPCAIAIKPWDGVGGWPADQADTPGKDLVYYPSSNKFDNWSQADRAHGAAWVQFTSKNCFLAVVMRGLGPEMYANSWEYPYWPGGDPLNGDHGFHGMPYMQRVYLYDPADLASVAAGSKNPYDVVPYESADITARMTRRAFLAPKACFDPGGRLFMTDQQGDSTQSQYSNYPVIFVWTTP